MIFLDTKCKFCNHYKYLNSDYGRLEADYHTCTKKIFSSTREDEWYKKAQKCNCFKTPYLLSKETLGNIKRFEEQRID